MIRINREKLDKAISAVSKCVESSTNVNGQKIIFKTNPEQIEHLICGALSIIAPNGGPVTPENVFYASGFKKSNQQSFPARIKKNKNWEINL